MVRLGLPGGYCVIDAAGPNAGLTHTISVLEMYRAFPPASPTTCDTSSSTYEFAPSAEFTPPNLHLRYLLGKKLVPSTVTSVLPAKGPRAGHTEN